MEKIKKNIVIAKGVIISLVITIILFYLLGILLSVTNLPEKIITPAIIIITGISILIGTSISTFKTEAKGLVKGGSEGLIYFIILYLFSSICIKNYGLNVYSVIMMIVSFVCGSIGGIVGVNLK